jgi:mRNA (guanine-N7-)-methyltransferase
MTYPKSNPVNKHDLISAAEVSLSRMSPSLSPQELLQEASNSITSNQSKSYPKKLSTIYTYNDAPAEPKPMTARLPIQGFCSLASIGLGTSSFLQPTLEGMTTCMVAVKRADDEYKKKLHLQPKDITNSNNFAILCRQLRDNEKCAFFVCPKTKRGGFIVAMDDTMDGCDYAAYCLVAPIDDLERILNQNGSNDVPMNADTADATTWNSNDEVAGESNDAGLWKPPTNENDGQETSVFESNNLWKPSTPPEQNDLSNSLWKPSTHPEQNDLSNNLWKPSTPPEQTDFYAQSTDMDATTLTTNEFEEPSSNTDNGNETFHANSGAAAADAFYSNLTRSLGTRADSMLYHMRNFNGWIKATQISELDPLTVDSSNSQSKKRKRTKHPLRVLDLACGKGGDLGKWVLHKRGIGNYVGIDVARGSLGDAAVRARKMRQLNKCVFTCADLGSDVPGRVKSNEHKKMQKLLSWSLKEDDGYGDPNFRLVRGGGIAETDKFDVVRYV